MKLEFNGPVHFDNVDGKTGSIIKNPNKLKSPNGRGIYIWGFIYECSKNGELLNPVDFSIKENILKYEKNGFKLLDNWKFIPYYVGKKEANIFSRIKTHHNILKGDATKYIRLSYSYMRNFFICPNFPVKYKRNRNNNQAINLLNSNPDSIEYFNDADFLKRKYAGIRLESHGRKGTDYPIILQRNISGQKLPDTLEELINHKNNFWFCYLLVDDLNANLTNYETFTFWSLKGKTVSETQKFIRTIKNLVIVDNTRTGIFDLNDNGELFPGDKFSGY